MEHCANCKKWTVQRVTDYTDGTRIINFKAPDGHGLCEYLNRDTDSDFGCNRFEEGHEHTQILGTKVGSPWHHHHWGPCPDCSGAGWACRRCAGSGKVLYYDDGYIGEEQTRLHPNEKKEPTADLRPRCVGCENIVDPEWVACPYCGVRTNKPSPPEITDELVGMGGKAALTRTSG